MEKNKFVTALSAEKYSNEFIEGDYQNLIPFRDLASITFGQIKQDKEKIAQKILHAYLSLGILGRLQKYQYGTIITVFQMYNLIVSEDSKRNDLIRFSVQNKYLVDDSDLKDFLPDLKSLVPQNITKSLDLFQELSLRFLNLFFTESLPSGAAIPSYFPLAVGFFDEEVLPAYAVEKNVKDILIMPSGFLNESTYDPRRKENENAVGKYDYRVQNIISAVSVPRPVYFPVRKDITKTFLVAFCMDMDGKKLAFKLTGITLHIADQNPNFSKCIELPADLKLTEPYRKIFVCVDK